MGRLVTLALVLLALAACATSSAPLRSEILGSWRYDSYTVDGTTEQVEAGVNATREPWATIDATTMSGHAGCNRFSGVYEVEGDYVTTELAKNAAQCGDDDSLMEAEQAFEAIVWHESPLQVMVDGDRMTWSNGFDGLVFVATETPPTTQPFQPDPRTEVGRLDCTPDIVTERRVPDEGRAPIDIAQEADSRVVSVESWEPLRHSGLDAEGEVVVELAPGDLPGSDYQVFTCSD